MRFVILKDNLNKALSIVGKGLSLKPQLPILSHILFKSQNNQLQLFSTNLELGIIYNTAAKIEKEGEVAVPGKLLTEFVNSIVTDKIEVQLDGNGLKVTSDKTKATLAVGNPADFPPFPPYSNPDKKLEYKKIKDAILRTVFAASTDEGRPVLTGVKTQIIEGKLLLSSTDGYRLSKEEVELSGKTDQMEAVLPAQSLTEMVRIAQEVDAEQVGISVIENKNQVVFDLPNTKIFTRLIDGEFPNVDKIIPEKYKTRVVIDKDLFLQTVKTASIFARGSANIVKLKIEKSGIIISANTPAVGEEESTIDAKVEGDEMEIAFNFRFLIEFLNNFPGQNVVFESEGPLNPGVFRSDKKDSSFLHIIMPVRVQN